MPHKGIDDGQIVSVRFARRIRKVPIFPPGSRYIWALDTTAHSDDAVDMAGQVRECFAVLPFCYHVDAVAIFKNPAGVLVDGPRRMGTGRNTDPGVSCEVAGQSFSQLAATGIMRANKGNEWFIH